ncbi:MAG TPA: hypothetical protein VFU15_16530 [Bacteroidia bacterium]|nr:hypothetical protein [Bacteroidia bacterium]
MKKIIFSAAGIFAMTAAVVIGSSFTAGKKTNVSGEIEFRITNNTGSEFDYCVNGGHNSIDNGSTKVFDYEPGQEFYYVEDDNCGHLWFKATDDMNGKSYNVTDLK